MRDFLVNIRVFTVIQPENHLYDVNQSINQSNHPSIHPSINQSINPSIIESTLCYTECTIVYTNMEN